MTPLRFALLTTFYPPFNFGGDGIDVQRTADALVRRGHRVTVVHDVDAYESLAGMRHPPAPEDQHGVEVVGLRSRLRVLSPIAAHQFGAPVVHGRTIDRLLRARQVDVVVFNNVSLIGGPGILAVGGEALKVYVAHEHWLVCPTHVLWRFDREPCDARACTRCVLNYRRPPQLWRYTRRLERALPEVDLFLARSEFSQRKHQEFGFPRPMQVLPYFVPGSMPPEPERRASGRPHARPYFLFVGRLERIKGLHTVLPAFERYPEADLLVAGEGREGDALRAHARDQANVHFLGRLTSHELQGYYEHAIAVIVPSVGYETFGLVLIEAFRRGTPVIARRQGSFIEIVGQSGGGLLFSDTEELLRAMACLQDDSQCRDAMGARGYRACRERWSEDVVVTRLLELVTQPLEDL